MENDKTMFDEIVRTEIKPDGTVEASLVDNSAQEMAASAADLSKAWKDFKDANGDQYGAIAVWTRYPVVESPCVPRARRGSFEGAIPRARPQPRQASRSTNFI